jgi:hypothetical protein
MPVNDSSIRITIPQAWAIGAIMAIVTGGTVIPRLQGSTSEARVYKLEQRIDVVEGSREIALLDAKEVLTLDEMRELALQEMKVKKAAMTLMGLK